MARDFSSAESLENRGILGVFPVFQTVRMREKTRHPAADAIVRCCPRFTAQSESYKQYRITLQAKENGFRITAMMTSWPWSCGQTICPGRFLATRHRMKHLKRRWIPSSLHNHPPTLTGGYAMLFQIFWLRVSQGQIDYPLTQKMLNLLLQFAPKKYLWNPQKSC